MGRACYLAYLSYSILWLCCSDWFTSDRDPYPFAASLLVTCVVVAACAAVAGCKASKRTYLFALFLLGLTPVLLFLSSPVVLESAFSGGLFADAGIALCVIGGVWFGELGLGHYLDGSRPTMKRLAGPAGAFFYGVCLMVGSPSLVAIRLYGSETAGISDCLASAGIALGAGLGGMVSIVAFNAARKSIRWAFAARILLVAASLAALGMFLAFPVGYQPGWDPKEIFLGSGLSGGRPSSGPAAIAETGLITFLITGSILCLVLIRNLQYILNGLAHATQNQEIEPMRLRLFVSALITLDALLALSFGSGGPLVYGGPVGWSALAFSITVMGITGKGPTDTGPLPALNFDRRRNRESASLAVGAGVFILALAAVVAVPALELSRKVDALGEQILTDSVSIPPSLLAVMQDNPTRLTFAEAHIYLRSLCGSRVSLPPCSLARIVVSQMAGPHKAPTLLAELVADLVALKISSEYSDDQIDRMALACADYGLPDGYANSAAVASQYYFHISLGELSPDQARFLWPDPEPQPGASLGASCCSDIHGFSPCQVTAYQFRELTTPSWIQALHEGTVNDRGIAVTYLAAVNGVQANADKVLSLPEYVDGRTHAVLWNNGKVRTLEVSGASATVAMGINQGGEAVGYADLSTGATPEMWSNGTNRALPLMPGWNSGFAVANNDRGGIVGYLLGNPAMGRGDTVYGVSCPVIWKNFMVSELQVPSGYTGGRAYAINNAGMAAGWLLTQTGQTHACCWDSNGKAHDLGAFAGGNISIATSINSGGQVVGSAEHRDGHVSAFLWQNGIMHDLGALPGDGYSKATSINDSGQVVGVSSFSPNPNGGGGRSFLWDCGSGMRDPTRFMPLFPDDMDNLARSSMAFSINNRGQILGMNSAATHRMMFLLTPQF